AEDVIKPEDAEDDGIPLVMPEMAGRHGAVPKLIRARSLSEEAKQIAGQLKSFHFEGRAWRDMAVLYCAHFIGDEIVKGLQQGNIPFERLEKGSSRKYKAGEDSVKLMTMHASKGLEFPIVAIAGLGHMPYRPDQEADDARLLYVAMTRATESLVLTAVRPVCLSRSGRSGRRRREQRLMLYAVSGRGIHDDADQRQRHKRHGEDIQDESAGCDSPCVGTGTERLCGHEAGL